MLPTTHCIVRRPQKMKFKDMLVGEIFFIENTPYIKIETSDIALNIINLTTGYKAPAISDHEYHLGHIHIRK